MDFFQVLRGRQSVRDFRPDPVPRPALQQLVDAGALAPSALNERPWRFIAVTDRSLLQVISNHAKKFIREDVEMLPNPQHFRFLFEEPDIDLFHGAPAAIVIAASSAGPWIAENCAVAAENVMLAAHALGLGSCWIGFAQGWMNSQQGRGILGLLPGEYVIAPIAVGWPRGATPTRASQPANLRWLDKPATRT